MDRPEGIRRGRETVPWSTVLLTPVKARPATANLPPWPPRQSPRERCSTWPSTPSPTAGSTAPRCVSCAASSASATTWSTSATARRSSCGTPPSTTASAASPPTWRPPPLAGAPDGDEIEALRAILVRYVEVTAERPALIRIINQEAARPGGRLDHVYEQYIRPAQEVADAVLRSLERQGRARRISPAALHFLVGHGAGGIVSLPALASKFPGDHGSLTDQAARGRRRRAAGHRGRRPTRRRGCREAQAAWMARRARVSHDDRRGAGPRPSGTWPCWRPRPSPRGPGSAPTRPPCPTPAG